MACVDLRLERQNFPTLLDRRYFAGQCLGAWPRQMLDDLRAYERDLALRSRCLDAWVGRWREMHRLAEDLLGAPPGSVMLRDSATAVQATIAACVEAYGKRRRILTSTADFHSSRYLWHAQTRRGFEVVEVRSRTGAHPDAEAIVEAIDERCAIVAVSLVSPRSGALLDARAIVAAARRAGALVILDAYQAIGVVPVRVVELSADVIVGGFHKWVGGGGTGLAFGYVAPELAANIEPVYPGWLGHSNLLGFCERFEPAPDVRKLEQGMPAMEPVYTSRAGLAWVLRVGIDAIRARSLELTQCVLDCARAFAIPVRTPAAAAERGGMVCLDVPDPAAVTSALGSDGFDVDWRPGAGLRVGPHPCATEEECAALVQAVHARVR